MGTELDRSRPYGTVYGGSTGASFHQDGKLFRSDGTEVGSTPAPAAPAPEPVPAAPEPAPEPEVSADDDSVSREELEALHVSKIKALMEMRGLTPETGPGSKAKNIEILLANG
jgi:hypothetical protein